MATKATTSKVSSSPTRHVYDVIILGGQLGGAFAAALLAKRGYKVLLIEHDGLGEGYEHQGFLLPFAPFISPPFKALGSVEEAFSELGLSTAISRTLRAHVPELQLVLPDHRLDLSLTEEPKRLAELTREYGPDAGPHHAAMAQLAAFHQPQDAFFKQPMELPADGFMETWGLKSLVKKAPQLASPLPALPEDGPSRALLDLIPFLTYLDSPEHPLAVARALSQALSQPSRFPNGREGFRELLTRKLQDLGGDLLTQENSKHFIAEELVLEGDRVVGIKLVQSETVYRAAAFIGATDAGALRRLVPDKKKHRKLTDLLDLSTTRKFLFTLNWVVPAEMLPRGMGELLLQHNDDEDLGPVLIQVLSARRVGKPEDEGLRVVCAGAFVPASTRELGESHLKGLSDRLGAQLDALMPFTRQHVKVVSAPYLDASSMRGSRLLPHPLFAFESAERVLGVEGLSQRTGTKNMFLASREVLPGLGLEGELLSAVRAARLVQESAKKLDPLK